MQNSNAAVLLPTLYNAEYTMASDLNFVEYVASQIKDAGVVTYKKMFGEYLIYVNCKPAILVCDNTVYVKKLPCLQALLEGAETGFPYRGAKEHYIIDADDRRLLTTAAVEIEKVAPYPQKRAVHKQTARVQGADEHV